MNTRNSAFAFRLLVLAALSLALLAIRASVFANPPDNGGNLFTDSAIRGSIDRSNDPTILRARFVSVNFDLLSGSGARAVKGATLALNLFGDTAFTAALDHVDAKANGIIWVGHVQDVALSTVTLVTEGNVMAGSIVMPEATYAVRYAGSGTHAIYKVNQAAFAPEMPPRVVDLPKSATPKSPAGSFSLYLPLVLNSASSQVAIDVMVLYTPAAVAAVGGPAAMTTLVNLGISETNTSYQNSSVNQRLNLAYAGQVSYTESGNMSTDLSNLQGGVGALSGVAALRDTNRADLVSLWVTGYSLTQGCGIGYLMQNVSATFAPNGYNVVDRDCVSPNYSFAHELGHNMGARHDWYVDTGSTTLPYTYAHAYIYAIGRWRTIMAYDSLCVAQGFNCTRLLYWSNPGINYGGVPMGVPEGTSTACTASNLGNPPCDADDHKALNNTAATVAGFK